MMTEKVKVVVCSRCKESFRKDFCFGANIFNAGDGSHIGTLWFCKQCILRLVDT